MPIMQFCNGLFSFAFEPARFVLLDVGFLIVIQSHQLGINVIGAVENKL